VPSAAPASPASASTLPRADDSLPARSQPEVPSLTFESRGIRGDQPAGSQSVAPQSVAPQSATRQAAAADAPRDSRGDAGDALAADSSRRSGADLVLPSPPPLGQVPVDVMASSADAPASQRLREGMALIERGQAVAARAMLSALLFDARLPLSERDAQSVRDVLASVNQSLVFSDRITPGDPLVEAYTVQSGDILVRIAPRYRITHRLIEQVNNVDARRLRVGQKLKVIKGPFHAVVYKSAFLMDVYVKGGDGQRVYVRSFRVGLGENDSTPVGLWQVRTGSKLVNPGWTHPRTHQYFAPDDPNNPIGEHWIGLEGTDENTRGRTGYGLHGTIEPQSIGRMMSLGCVRMQAEDIAAMFDLLVEEHSTVEVLP
jgi:LysM repeat protein